MFKFNYMATTMKLLLQQRNEYITKLEKEIADLKQ
jgi:hypothetical protein